MRQLASKRKPSEDSAPQHSAVTQTPLDQWKNTQTSDRDQKQREQASRWFAVTHSASPSCSNEAKNNRAVDDGLLLVVKAHIGGHQLHALIDSGATRCFVHPKFTTMLHLDVGHDKVALELADGTKILSQGSSSPVRITVAESTVSLPLTVSQLLPGIDLILGANWLDLVNPMID